MFERKPPIRSTQVDVAELAEDLERAKKENRPEPDEKLEIDTETVYHILVHRASHEAFNEAVDGVQRQAGGKPTEARFGKPG